MQKSVVTASFALCLALQGCATLMGDESQIVPINSTPPGASILVTDEQGKIVYRGKTPVSIAIKKSTGKYWGGKNFRIKLAKDGYISQNIQVNSSPNALYLAGNLLVSGGIGWFMVDPFNGKMYSLAPEGIDATLTRSGPPPAPPAPVAQTPPTQDTSTETAITPPPAPLPSPPPVSDNKPPQPATPPQTPNKTAANIRKDEMNSAMDAAPQGDLGASEAIRRLAPSAPK